MPMPIEPGTGRLQLTIKKNKKAALEECNKKVVLELTGDDDNSDRPGLDLVAVMDVSGSMYNKMDQLKNAMGFVLRKLSPIDRLSIVTFSSAATKLCSLRQITLPSLRELQEIINSLLEMRHQHHGGPPDWAQGHCRPQGQQ